MEKVCGEGTVVPDEKSPSTCYKFKYSDGAEDKLSIWREVRTKVFYCPPQRPLTVNGLAIEIYLKNDNGHNMRIWNDKTILVTRSGITFNNMRISCKNRNATHLHTKRDEFVYIISGHGLKTVGDKVYELRAGSAYYLPKGVPHWMLNTHATEPIQVVGFYPDSSDFDGTGYEYLGPIPENIMKEIRK